MKILMVLLILVSCSTNTKQARRFMEAGSWEKAHEMWIKILNNKPSNKEALAGKKAAEFRITNKYVIGTRHHRQRGDHRGAMESALKIHNYLIEWNSSMDPDMAKYQHKELKQLYPAYIKIINESITNDAPLKASSEYKRFYPLFESIQIGELITLRENIRANGKKKCQQLLPTGLEYPFWRQFVSKVCSFYKISDKKFHNKSEKLSFKLYSKIHVNTNITKMPPVHTTMVKQYATNAFKKSPWYHPQAKKSVVTNIVGEFFFSKKDYRVKKTKQYTIIKPKQDHKTGSKLQDDPLIIEKSFIYYITKYQQELSIELASEFSIEDQEVSIVHQEEYSDSDWSYEGNKGTPYIHSKTERLIKKNYWFQNQYQKYQEKMLESLKQAWTRNYCHGHGEDLSMEAMGDYILRCQRGEDNSFTSIIDNWHQNHFGIDHLAMKALLGKYY